MASGPRRGACSPNVWVAVWCILVGGIGNATAIVCNSLLVQRGAPDHLRGRVFTMIMGSNFAVLGIGMALAGVLVDAVGPRWVWGIARRRRRRRGRARVRDAPPDAPGACPRAGDAVTPTPDAATGRARRSSPASARGDRRALARAITLVENGDPLAYELVRELYPETGHAPTRSASPGRPASASRA